MAYRLLKIGERLANSPCGVQIFPKFIVLAPITELNEPYQRVDCDTPDTVLTDYYMVVVVDLFDRNRSERPINSVRSLLVNGRSFWEDYLTDDPSAWRVRVGEHHMFSDVDVDQVDVDVENIIFHPNRNRKRLSLSSRFRQNVHPNINGH